MDTKSRFTLVNETGVLAGFAFGKHPVDPNKSVNVVVYKVSDGWVICMSEPMGPGKPELLRPALGSQVAGKDFAPFAVRHLEGELAYADLKKVMDEMKKTVKGISFEWASETQVK